MNFVEQAVTYLLTAGNWTGPVGLATRTLEHLEYTGVAVGASALVAIPLGLIIGHTGRGTLLVDRQPIGFGVLRAARSRLQTVRQQLD